MKKKEIEETLNPSSKPAAVIQSSSSNSMVDIVVRIKEDETFANLKVSSFDLILSLEFLMKLAQFVSVPQDPSVKLMVVNNAISSSLKGMSNIQLFLLKIINCTIFWRSKWSCTCGWNWSKQEDDSFNQYWATRYHPCWSNGWHQLFGTDSKRMFKNVVKLFLSYE